jgi:hypothetical protein
MITNRNAPYVTDLIDGLPSQYKDDATTALDELDAKGLSSTLNPKNIKFNDYKIEVANGDIEIIFKHDLAGNIRIVDIKHRANLKGILRKIADAIDISP